MKKLKLTTKEAVDYLKKEVKIHDNLEISYNRIFAEGEVLNMDFSEYFGKSGQEPEPGGDGADEHERRQALSLRLPGRERSAGHPGGGEPRPRAQAAARSANPQ